jgi:hypothetical protein
MLAMTIMAWSLVSRDRASKDNTALMRGTVADIGLSRKYIHEARIVRDAEMDDYRAWPTRR